MGADKEHIQSPARRKVLKQCLMGGCGMALGAYTLWDLFLEGGHGGLAVGFRNDAPGELWKWSKEADWYSREALHDRAQVHCKLCPHECILGENDRGFCRTRVVKNTKLYSIAYGNPCSVHVDPIEKKPLYHFLPRSTILSLATAGCNLRCLNCQNWEISQTKPETTRNYDLMPNKLVQYTKEQNIKSIAYTYSEPLIFYEYVYDSAQLAIKQQINNVLVTAGYILPKPLRKLCKVIQAANVDLKAFNDDFYKRIAGATLAPVLRALEIMREEGVWIEVTRLIVPTLSDDLYDIEKMSKWIVDNLGADTPLHFSRFHPAYRLRRLAPTPTYTLLAARKVALNAGLNYVYIGNHPGLDGQNTQCPVCKKLLIERNGYHTIVNFDTPGLCSCGHMIAGVWS